MTSEPVRARRLPSTVARLVGRLRQPARGGPHPEESPRVRHRSSAPAPTHPMAGTSDFARIWRHQRARGIWALLVLSGAAAVLPWIPGLDSQSIWIAPWLGAGGLLVAAAFFLLAMPGTRRYQGEWRSLVNLVRQLRGGNLAVASPVLFNPGAAALGEELAALAVGLRTERDLRSRLTRDIAHEFRTPLAVLRSQVEAIQDGVWAPTVARMELFAQEIGRLSGLVEDLDHLADAEAQSLALARSQFSLRELLDGLTDSFEPLFARKGLEFRYDPPAEFLQLHADRDKVGRIIINLLSNAYKYTPEGGRVALAAWLTDTEVMIGVADTGPGIAVPDMQHLFDRSFRGRLERGIGGSGLGLTIARTLAEAHGGRIEVYSQPGVGSEFTVILPGNGS